MPVRGVSSRSDRIEAGEMVSGSRLDYGKCIGCQLCTESCPTEA